MKKPTKVLLGIVTVWPIIYMIIFFTFIILMFVNLQNKQPASQPDHFFTIIILHIATIICVIGLLLVYFVHLLKNDRLTQQQKLLWAVLLFVGIAITMPIYWYLYVWRNSSQASGASLA